jgi:hypothetical protein
MKKVDSRAAESPPFIFLKKVEMESSCTIGGGKSKIKGRLM